MKNAFIQQLRATTVSRFFKKRDGGSRRVAITGKMNYYLKAKFKELYLKI